MSSYDGSKHIISANQISIQKKLGSGEFGTVQQGIWTNCNERVSLTPLKALEILPKVLLDSSCCKMLEQGECTNKSHGVSKGSRDNARNRT